MNIVVVDIDALRPDHLGAYGYDIATPHIDAVADDGAVFENAYTANSPSLPSRAALMTGRCGVSSGGVTHGPDAYTISSPHTWDAAGSHRRDYWTVPELFFKDRMRTGAVASDGRHPAPWLYHVWHEYHQPQEPEGDDELFMTVRGETVADRATAFMDRHRDDEFLLYSQFWDTHAPYRVPDDIDTVTADEIPLPPYPTAEQITEHGTWDAWRCGGSGVTDRNDLAELLAQYDTAVRYVDRQVGRIVTALKDRGLYDETLLVITADHGEEFGAHGVYQDHWSTYDGTQQVPLIIKPPASASVENGPRDQLVTNVDIGPTLADYAGLDAPRAWQGRSLRPVMAQSNTAWRDHIVLDHGLYTAQRAVRTQDWKLIRTYHPGTWGHALPEMQLFDMTADPWEQDDVSDDNPARVRRLHRQMKRFVDDHVDRDGDPLMAVAADGPIGSMGQETDVAAWHRGR
jgi:arylsulfatase A-like enzyme